jgi:hypothetical protein
VLRRAVRSSLVLLIATALVPAAAQAQKACGKKTPGGPDAAAVLQYCPKEVRDAPERESSGGSPVGVSDSGSGSAGPPASKPPPPPVDKRNEIPFTDYPADGGVGAIFWILLALLALLAGRALYRRYGQDGDALRRARALLPSRGN